MREFCQCGRDDDIDDPCDCVSQMPRNQSGAVWLALIIAALLTLAVTCSGAEPSISVPCKIVEVYDGDTMTVEITFQARVRMLDCWSPEVRTKDAEEKQRGIAARDYLRSIANDKHALLTIPLSGKSRLDDLFTFGRLLGDVRLNGDAKTLSELMVGSGHATKTKIVRQFEAQEAE